MRGLGAKPRRGVRGGGGGQWSPPPKKFKFLLSPEGKNTKSVISQKLRIAQKKSFMPKMSVWSIQIFPANLATFKENLIFGRPKRPFWTPVAHLLCSDGHFEGMGVCISLVGIQSDTYCRPTKLWLKKYEKYHTARLQIRWNGVYICVVLP